MDTKAVVSLVDQLEENIEDLEDNLGPLLDRALSTTTKKLPLLDRAKLNVLLVYSIESLLFSYLKLQGIAVKEHPVFKELTRVKQYFEKIKENEARNTKSQPHLTLDKDAAGRFIKHALAGNERYDLERAEREAREKILASKKLKDLEATMRDKAEAPAEADEAADTDDALQLAAELASLAQAEVLNELSSPDNDGDSDTGDNDASSQEDDHMPPVSTPIANLPATNTGASSDSAAKLGQAQQPSSQKRKSAEISADVDRKKKQTASKKKAKKARKTATVATS